MNYLDDFFFAALCKLLCDLQVQSFLELCNDIRFPVSLEKMFWGMTKLTFLGMLLDSERQIVAVPEDKILKGKVLLTSLLGKKKTTVHKLQSLCGFLNFLGRSVIPGRAFTRRLYSRYAGNPNLKQQHHIKITSEMRLDMTTWLSFLNHPSIFSRRFLDFSQRPAKDISFYTDASKTIGFGGICGQDWMHEKWNRDFTKSQDPSISYLELYAVTAGIISWLPRFQNMSIVLYCDNQGAIEMINSSTSKCKQCMKLIRIIILNCLIYNVKVSSRHVRGVDNEFSDYLSRDRIQDFLQLAKDRGVFFNQYKTHVSDQIWPLEQLWLSDA